MVLSKPLHAKVELPPVEAELPPVDERLVEPETRYEMYDGELVYVPPADFAHGERQVKASGLIEVCVRPEFSVATEVLTRASRTSDIAPDISVHPRALDPATGRRQIAQLAFEVVSKQSLGNAADKARRLLGRGVRRVFAIDVEHGRAMEWSGALGAWQLLDLGACIEDPVLAVPLAIEPLVKAAIVDDAIARALVVKNNPVIAAEKADSRRKGKAEGREEGLVEGRQEGLAEGRHEGLAEGRQEGLAEGRHEGVLDGVRRSLLQLLAARGIALDPTDRARILDERDLQRLERWFARAAQCASIADMFADS
jgi:Uma2 family endonuclease